MSSNPDQEREEVRNELAYVNAQQADLLAEASSYYIRGDAVPQSILNGLASYRAAEYVLLMRRSVVDSVPPPAPLVWTTTIPVSVIIERLEAEGVGQVYTDYMWATNGRRWAYIKAVLIRKVIESNDQPARNSMLTAITGSGSPPKTAQEAQDIVNRVMAI